MDNIPTEKTILKEDSKFTGPSLATQLPSFEVPQEKDGEAPSVPNGILNAMEIPKEKSSMTLSIFNYVNSITGSGMIGMPYAIYQSGYGLGLLLLVVVAVATDTSLTLMIEAGKIADVASYQNLAGKAFGTPGFILQSVLQFMYPFISLISYNIIVGDTLTKVLIRVTGISPNSVLVNRAFLVPTATLLVTLPLSLYKNISRLAKISLVSVVLIVTISLAMLIRLPTMMYLSILEEETWTFAKLNVSSTVGIMSFAFMCHHSSFMIYDALIDNTQERWNKTTHVSVGVSGLLSLIYGYAGYFSFSSYAQGDIFENYCWRDDLMNLCRGLYTTTILLTFPIECFVAREVLETSFFKNHQPQPIVRHAFLTVMIALIGMMLSLSTDCLGVFLELNGILCAIPLAYIFPAICYLRVQEGSVFNPVNWKAWCLITFGLVMFIFGSMSLSNDISSLSQCSHGEQMPYCFVDANLTKEVKF